MSLATFAVLLIVSAAPGVNVSNGVKFMSTTNDLYPLRFDDTLNFRWRGLWAYDLLHIDLPLPGSSKSPIVNNRVIAGYSLLSGFGPAYQRQDYTGRKSSNYVGINWTRTFVLSEDVKITGFFELMKGIDTRYNFRFDGVVLCSLPHGLWVNNFFAADMGNGHQVSNKVYVGYSFVKMKPTSFLSLDFSIVANRNDASSRPTIHMVGLEAKGRLSL